MSAIALSVVTTPGMLTRREGASAEEDVQLVAFEDDLIERIPLSRDGAADDVARLALYCASNLAEFNTGQLLSIDGGLAAA